jgi:hypothetical protein
MKRTPCARATLVAVVAFLSAAVAAATSEIRVDLKLDGSDFVSGERVRGVVDVANSSPEKVSVGYVNSEDMLFVEVFRAGDMSQLERVARRPFVARFRIESGEGQKLETFLGDHYDLRETRRYLAKPVLVHDGYRYEGAPRVFDVVDGVKVVGATQVFANRKGLQREFSVVYWSRNHSEHVFLKARDAGSSSRMWETRDLGAILRIEAPSISIMKTGEIVVLHRLNQDQFIRSEFWSLPDALEFRVRETVQDPETAATSRVRDLYRKEGVKPKENPWWKFW